jgi:hypothetical protein
MNHEVLDLGLVYYTDVIDNGSNIIDKIESLSARVEAGEHGTNGLQADPWEAWWDEHLPKPFNYRRPIFRKENVSQHGYYAKELTEIADLVYGGLDKAFEHYSTVLYPFAAKNIKSEEPGDGILKYIDGGHLPAHHDHGVSSRTISAVIYLNDDYDGGEIEFKQSNVKIKPRAGSVVFFPSNYLYIHEVFPVSNGIRYAVPHWYHNMKTPVMSDGTE